MDTGWRKAFHVSQNVLHNVRDMCVKMYEYKQEYCDYDYVHVMCLFFLLESF